MSDALDAVRRRLMSRGIPPDPLAALIVDDVTIPIQVDILTFAEEKLRQGGNVAAADWLDEWLRAAARLH